MTDEQHHEHRHLFHRHEHTTDEELSEAEEVAGFDLGADISQPLKQTHHETFDRDKDLGLEHPE